MSEHDILDEKKHRSELFEYLDDILTVAHKKYDMEEKNDDSRLKWGRLMVSAIDSYGTLLKTTELEAITRDIELIKEKIGLKTT